MSTPTIFSLTLQDTNGEKVSTRAHVSYNGAVVTVDSLIGSWLEYGGLVDDATNAEIVGGSILIPCAPDVSWKDAPVAGTDVSDVIVTNFTNATTKYVWGHVLPAFLAAMLSGGNVDLTNVALAALIGLLDNSTGGTSVQYQNPSAQDLVALRDAFQSDRKSAGLRTVSRVYP